MPLKVNTYVSDGSVLLAFDMPRPNDDFAGFAVQCHPKGHEPYYLLNRLNFTRGVDKSTTPDERPCTTSDKAPFHDKFVVVDFNGDNPSVFTGSSNLAKGGEMANGDNLLAIHDRDLATGFVVEGIRLVDHYHFRMLQSQHPSSNPVTLQGRDGAKGKRWWEGYYDKDDPKYNERTLFSR